MIVLEAVKEKDGMITHYEFCNGGVEQQLANVHGTKFHEYRKKWNYCNKNLIASEKPLYIVLEVNTYCNLKCKMCEKNYYTKNRYDISSEVLDKIVDECKKIELPSILVGAAAEALLMPNIKSILKKIKTIGAMDNFLITNGTMLTNEVSELLIDEQYERLYVSVDAATQETYKKIRGYNIQVVERNIENFLKIRKEKNKNLPLIRVSYVLQDENREELKMFINKWKDKVDIIDIQEEIDFSNINDLKEYPNIIYRCDAPFTTLSLDCEGNIYPCCTFYRKYLKLGNIKDMTLMEAWNCPEMQQLRKEIKCGKLCKACRNCASTSMR